MKWPENRPWLLALDTGFHTYSMTPLQLGLEWQYNLTLNEKTSLFLEIYSLPRLQWHAWDMG